MCLAHRLQFFACFPSSRNDAPSTWSSTQGRGRNSTELDLGCREDVEVRECFSSPEILELKAQCELARYRVAAPNRLHVPSDSLDQFSKSFQGIFVEGVINCLSWRYKLFVHNATAVAKKNKHCFHPGSAHVCFLQTRRTFRVPFCTLPFGLGIVVKHPWFICCYYFIQKNLVQFRVFPANPDKFPTGSLFAPQTSFSALVLHRFFACANGLLEFYELHFYPSPFRLQSS